MFHTVVWVFGWAAFNGRRMTQPLVSVVITTHGQSQDLPTILSCLQRQKDYSIGGHSRTSERVKYSQVSAPTFEAPEIVIASDGRYTGPWPGPNNKIIEIPREPNSVGHHTRAPGIEAATGRFVVLTNQDNLFPLWFMSRLTQTILEHEAKATAPIGLIYYNCVNNLWCCKAHNSKLERGGIDLSCIAVNTNIAKEVGFPWREYDADADYIMACAQLCNRLDYLVIYIPEVWSIHC